MAVKFILPVAVIGIVAGVIAAALAKESSDERVISHGSYLAYYTAEELVYESDSIIRATFLHEKDDKEVLSPSPDLFVRYDVIRTYRIEEVLKGDRLQAGEELVIRISTGMEIDGTFVNFLPLNPVDNEQIYVLFLQLLHHEDEEVWRLNGTPTEAVLKEGGELEFLTSHDFQESMNDSGRPILGSNAPFELHLTRLQSLIASNTPPNRPVIREMEVGTPFIGTTPLPTITPPAGP